MEEIQYDNPTDPASPSDRPLERHELAQRDAEFQEGSSDERLFRLLLYGATVEAAAVGAGVSRRTAYRRLEDPEFRMKLENARARVRENIIQRLADATGAAIDRLWHLMESEELDTQFRACGMLLNHFSRVQKVVMQYPSVFLHRHSLTEQADVGESHMQVIKQETSKITTVG